MKDALFVLVGGEPVVGGIFRLHLFCSFLSDIACRISRWGRPYFPSCLGLGVLFFLPSFLVFLGYKYYFCGVRVSLFSFFFLVQFSFVVFRFAKSLSEYLGSWRAYYMYVASVHVG